MGNCFHLHSAESTEVLQTDAAPTYLAQSHPFGFVRVCREEVVVREVLVSGKAATAASVATAESASPSVVRAHDESTKLTCWLTSDVGMDKTIQRGPHKVLYNRHWRQDIAPVHAACLDLDCDLPAVLVQLILDYQHVLDPPSCDVDSTLHLSGAGQVLREYVGQQQQQQLPPPQHMSDAELTLLRGMHHDFFLHLFGRAYAFIFASGTDTQLLDVYSFLERVCESLVEAFGLETDMTQCDLVWRMLLRLLAQVAERARTKLLEVNFSENERHLWHTQHVACFPQLASRFHGLLPDETAAVDRAFLFLLLPPPLLLPQEAVDSSPACSIPSSSSSSSSITSSFSFKHPIARARSSVHWDPALLPELPDPDPAVTITFSLEWFWEYGRTAAWLPKLTSRELLRFRRAIQETQRTLAEDRIGMYTPIDPRVQQCQGVINTEISRREEVAEAEEEKEAVVASAVASK